ncbi:RdRP-domain-containing protein [Didymella exigua CBS 183.55]|uniref:RNA-dependent RNA polymerase n=1 Tax=Didymella exigua CBS 183.55 TaxID=1150837 RepID=A0A6A5RNQ8_9PLEO|nr:RdRP-domain-containing protein [Didymella exigua CBS 183.55]KAF1929053.1 RdRP-domain-containing protein [Didymella exigua CBS 183.55]
MDIFVHDVPSDVNHVQLRLFLKPKMELFDILAFDIFKKSGNHWALLTVASEVNGNRFIKHFQTQERLVYQGRHLKCKKSNKKAEALKIMSLLDKEDELRKKAVKLSNPRPQPSQPHFSFTTMMTGVWDYDGLGNLVFDQKYKDPRRGTIIFGKTALVIYLESSKGADTQADCNCRIDIPYGILEHTIPATDKAGGGSLTLTLKSPPKIYKINATDSLHLYTGGASANAMAQMPSWAFNALSLGAAAASSRQRQLHRLCALQRHYYNTTALCMVYKLRFANAKTMRYAWNFISDFAVSGVDPWRTSIGRARTLAMEKDYANLELALTKVVGPCTSFGVAYQMMALVLEGTVPPRNMTQLIPRICNLTARHGSTRTAAGVRELAQQIPTPAPNINGDSYRPESLIDMIDANVNESIAEADGSSTISRQGKYQHLALTYKATVTPTGLVLRGPEWGVSNRVLRRYSAHTEYFMRVFFADEDGLSVFHDPRSSQEDVYDRFRHVLRNGISIAGRTFEFLGFSHASLRYHAAWFMAPFEENDVLVRAKHVIAALGDFSNIHCSAKCAARIGQAFSDTVHAIHVPLDAYVVETKEDIVRNGRTFSDGCGTISEALLQRVWRSLPPDRRSKRPTVLQIRYRGAKGVVSLDDALLGEQLHIRTSMTKYVAREGWRDLELCGAAYRPLTMYLNHQFIKILEDLRVSLRNFFSVQDDALKTLEMMVNHPLNAASFLAIAHTGVYAKVPRLITLMHYIGLSFQADRFLTDVVEIAAMSSLRDLKYRARIPIDKGCLLYGIMDETNTLQEGEVYIATQLPDDHGEWQHRVITHDRLVVTRAPALHPGDVQTAKAVDVERGSPLKSLRNCIVFSQRGERDLPSQLSGGDLDGDLFHIIWDERLIPPITKTPADYAPTPARDLGRPVEVNDIVDFFIEFMNMDRLGVISNKHKIRADRKPAGTLDTECLMLARLASDAVDFSKSGNPIPPGADSVRPDFMAPGRSLVINDLGTAELDELEDDDVDDPDSLSVLDPEKSRIRYYKSHKALGELYRRIDEKKFFTQMRDSFQTVQTALHGESLLEKLERYVDREAIGLQWEHHQAFATELREEYEDNMVDIMYSMRPHRGQPLTELEVFSGNILGKKERSSTRAIREANKEVQERFDRDVSDIARRIARGDGGWDGPDDAEALPRAIACFKVALETDGWENQVVLRSWKYVAAAVCLEQLNVYRLGQLRPL